MQLLVGRSDERKEYVNALVTLTTTISVCSIYNRIHIIERNQSTSCRQHHWSVLEPSSRQQEVNLNNKEKEKAALREDTQSNQISPDQVVMISSSDDLAVERLIDLAVNTSHQIYKTHSQQPKVFLIPYTYDTIGTQNAFICCVLVALTFLCNMQ